MPAARSRFRFRPALGVFLALIGFSTGYPSRNRPAPDKEPYGSGLIVSPRTVGPGDAVRVLAVSESAVESGRIEVKGPAGAVATSNQKAGGGPPFWWSIEFKPDRMGDFSVILSGRQGDVIRRTINVVPSASRPTGKLSASPSIEEWNRSTENLYSAWVERLFAEADEKSSWKALHDVTRNAGDNILYDHLGLAEDDPSGPAPVLLEPDCADAPYFLRAYFAWKMGLPFGFRLCTRGSLAQPPRCPDWFSLDGEPGARDDIRGFNRFLKQVMDTIHSGSARVALEDGQSDHYPLALSKDGLRPGVTFADPYGHTLTLVRWIRQTSDQPGRLLAVDAQPDGTVGLKRFWRGNFLFNTEGVIGNPGFKAFRPIRRTSAGRERPLTNDEILLYPDGGYFSLEQKGMAAGVFYDALERLINPQPLDPTAALRELVAAFHEQLQTRVVSVANAEEYMNAHPGEVIPMPSAPAAVFQDLGPWEDYSTPNRDMRLLLAMDVLRSFPERVVRSPRSFILGKDATPERMKEQLTELLDRLVRETSITYARSDGTSQTLSLEDILKRSRDLETAYNPNDGVEIRWGAPEGSSERASCRRRAPLDQIRRMESLRSWFQRRLRPPT